ncbi:class I SAM-dependent methyltransferase [Leisingera sp. NJS204]|uniref:class I SAM-dependent methyltransferase n=1 Tax=Leisingera sp. NJS204 TaxID=2508307 RepID=UPI0010111932|nr:class I SAM-dependent methyltransferase [Leisingera sp. NJS204]QAX29325.1 class I SAM-dependent methyltransferase [Leisingera sp. NJS204]
MDNGWQASADAWITLMGVSGDFSRQHVLDHPMLNRVRLRPSPRILDVGCGEGRFCRMLAPFAGNVTGLDPTDALLRHAEALSDQRFVKGTAEALPFADASFDIVVSYLTLIDIPDTKRAIAEMTRVLAPGGHLLIANLNSWITASQSKGGGWTRDQDGAANMCIDRYFEEHHHWGEWNGMRIKNWHRPQAFYMQALLNAGLQLTHFDEPMATGGERADSYNRAPYLYLMEWQKPAG